MQRRVSRRICVIWAVGTLAYLAGSVFLTLAQILIPAWGAIVLFGCTIASMLVDETDGLVLFSGLGIQTVLAALFLQWPAGKAWWFPPYLQGVVAIVALLGPLAMGLIAVTRAFRRDRAASQAT